MDDNEVQRLNDSLIEIHSRRLAELGSDESGLFNHYAQLIGDKSVVRPQELKVLNLILDELPSFEEYVVLRAGLGELALLLERSGLRTMACEANARRFKALAASVDRLARMDIPNDRRLRALEGFLPPTLRAQTAIAVAVDFGYNVALEDDEEFRRRLRQFNAILFNPRLFIHFRHTERERQAGIDYLRSQGFGDFKEFPKLELMFATFGSAAATSDALPAMEPPPAGEGGFRGLVERVMWLVPEAVQPETRSTWVERRIRHFDMKSAFGNGE